MVDRCPVARLWCFIFIGNDFVSLTTKGANLQVCKFVHLLLLLLLLLLSLLLLVCGSGESGS